MRKLSSDYSVTYRLLDRNGETILDKQSVCYSELYREKVNETNVLILSDFLAIETKEHSKRYIKRLAKICGVKLVFVNDNEITLTGFKSIFYVKTFTSLFRILFEVYNNYGKENDIPNTVNFFEKYMVKRSGRQYKDMLSKLIYCYQKSNMFQGGGHGITCYRGQEIPIKTIKDLQEWKCRDNDDMQDFFKQK